MSSFLFVVVLLFSNATTVWFAGGTVALASENRPAASWEYIGCFKRDYQSLGIKFGTGYTWSMCREKAIQLGVSKFALASRADTTASCHVGAELTSAGIKSTDPCDQWRGSDGHIYGGGDKMAVYGDIDGVPEYLGCFENNNQRHGSNIRIPGLVTWSQCRQKAIAKKKTQFALRKKLGSHAICVVGDDFIRKREAVVIYPCSFRSSDSHVYGDVDELAVYEHILTTTTTVTSSSTTTSTTKSTTTSSSTTTTSTKTTMTTTTTTSITETSTTPTTTTKKITTTSTTTTKPTRTTTSTTASITTVATTTTATITSSTSIIVNSKSEHSVDNAHVIVSKDEDEGERDSSSLIQTLLLGIVAGVIPTAGLIGAAIFIAFTMKNMNLKMKKDKEEDPYHLIKYGLHKFADIDQLSANYIRTKTFESSNFRVLKDALNQRLAKINGILPVRYITDAIRGLILNHSNAKTMNYGQIDRVMVQTEIAMAQNNEHAEDAGVKAEMFWSSALSIQGAELCSILNAAIRADDPHNIVHAVVFAKGIEMRRNMDRNNVADLTQKYPDKRVTADMFPGGKFPKCLEHKNWLACFRGGGFDDDVQKFFTVGKYYRCPGVLATTSTKEISIRFMRLQRLKGTAAVVWTVLLDARGITDPQYRCMHASFVVKSHQSNESEFLFSPYSVFQVVETEWSSSRSKPHSIVLRAAIDNIGHEEDLPLAPWY